MFSSNRQKFGSKRRLTLSSAMPTESFLDGLNLLASHIARFKEKNGEDNYYKIAIK